MMKLINTLKTLLLLFVFAFVGFNISSGMYQYFQVGLDQIQSDWNNQYDINFLKKGVLNSSYLGTFKPLVALNDQYLLFWNQYGLYLYNYNTYKSTNKYGLIQGYFQYVVSCDEITESGDGISNCSSSQNILGSDEVVSNFLKTLSNGDWIYIYDDDSRLDCGSYCTYDRYRISVCFSSQSIGKTLCFLGDLSSTSLSPYNSSTPLTGSMQLGNNINFGNINRGILYNPPGFIAGGSDGTGSISSPGVVVGMCPTILELIKSEESTYGYSSSLCYSPTKIISLSGEPTIEEVESQSIFELYPSYSSFAEDVSLYNSCTESLHCSLAFSGRAVNYAFINNYIKSVSNSRHQSFYNYCNAVINLDPNSTICTNSTGSQVLPGTEYNSQEEMINGMVSNMNIYNYYSYNWGSGSSSGENESGFSFDVLSDSRSGVNELFTSFNFRDGINGILPKYIVIGFLGILLLYVFKR